MTSSQPTITLFGATGPTGLAFLKLLLAASLPTTVLVRTPSKLLSLLSLPTLPPNLRIITGSITSPTSTRAALTTPTGSISSIIVSCIGFVADPAKKSLNPMANVDDTGICETAVRNILGAVREMKGEIGGERKDPSPLLVVLSTTGISDCQRDIPVAMVPLYHWMLGLPHRDKRAMEEVLGGKEGKGVRWVVVRPSLMVGDGRGEGRGMGAVRVGLERGGVVERKAVGYYIRREDVAGWMFEEVVRKGGKGWEGAAVGLTY